MSEILGYVQPWTTFAGSAIDVKVSTTGTNYKHRLVRLIQGYEHPEGAPYREEVIESVEAGSHEGRYQKVKIGSYGLVDTFKIPEWSDNLQFSLWVYPTYKDEKTTQTILSLQGLAIFVSLAGTVNVNVSGTLIDTHYSMRLKRWYFIDFNFSQSSLSISISQKGYGVEARDLELSESYPLSSNPVVSGPLYLAAQGTESGKWPSSFFNGKLDSVKFAVDGKPLAVYDFSKEISSNRIVDSCSGLHGILFNNPGRGIAGFDWDATCLDWTKAKYGYGAVYFHDDDLEDAGWDTDFSINLPKDLRSGVYAVQVTTDDGATDSIVFFVRPDPKNHAKIGFIMSTFTILAYANEHLFESFGQREPSVQIHKDLSYHTLVNRRDLGPSLYDLHKDGSGTMFASAKKPMVNMRPREKHWGFGGPRAFGADLLGVGFMEKLDMDYEVLTDHDIHEFGLDGYDVVLTGSHPEYPSKEMLNAYTKLTSTGGKFMYLGGNGFYWVTTYENDKMEVRRAGHGCREFELPPSDGFHAMTGDQGGLWRYVGRPSNHLVGISSSACGLGEGCGYKRSEASYKNKFAAFFEGISEDVIGDFGLIGGACGDEIDRYAPEFGSPESCVILATSTGLGDHYNIFNEECMFPIGETTGTKNPKIRSDVVYLETEGGGSVFAVGSINWLSAVVWHDYDNNIAKLTANVVRSFASKKL